MTDIVNEHLTEQVVLKNLTKGYAKAFGPETSFDGDRKGSDNPFRMCGARGSLCSGH